MNDRRYRLKPRPTDTEDWSHERQILLLLWYYYSSFLLPVAPVSISCCSCLQYLSLVAPVPLSINACGSSIFHVVRGSSICRLVLLWLQYLLLFMTPVSVVRGSGNCGSSISSGYRLWLTPASSVVVVSSSCGSPSISCRCRLWLQYLSFMAPAVSVVACGSSICCSCGFVVHGSSSICMISCRSWLQPPVSVGCLWLQYQLFMSPVVPLLSSVVACGSIGWLAVACTCGSSSSRRCRRSCGSSICRCRSWLR